jgi:hypothetical protein
LKWGNLATVYSPSPEYPAVCCGRSLLQGASFSDEGMGAAGLAPAGKEKAIDTLLGKPYCVCHSMSSGEKCTGYTAIVFFIFPHHKGGSHGRENKKRGGRAEQWV